RSEQATSLAYAAQTQPRTYGIDLFRALLQPLEYWQRLDDMTDDWRTQRDGCDVKTTILFRY
ncbi:hypothetical protein C3E98_042460, partial [Pseudomonas sp. MWU13-2625]